jgi:hypothetical protein
MQSVLGTSILAARVTEEPSVSAEGGGAKHLGVGKKSIDRGIKTKGLAAHTIDKLWKITPSGVNAWARTSNAAGNGSQVGKKMTESRAPTTDSSITEETRTPRGRETPSAGRVRLACRKRIEELGLP